MKTREDDDADGTFSTCPSAAQTVLSVNYLLDADQSDLMTTMTMENRDDCNRLSAVKVLLWV